MDELEPIEAPDPPRELEEKWYQEVVPRLKSEQIRIGLLHYLNGDGWRVAARKVGVSHTVLRDAAERHGLRGLGARDQHILSMHRQVAHEAGSQLLERLESDDPDNTLTAKELSIVSAISTDKILAHQRLQRESGADGLSGLDKLAAAIADSRISLKLEVTPTEPAVDVTPREVNTVGRGAPKQS